MTYTCEVMKVLASENSPNFNPNLRFLAPKIMQRDYAKLSVYSMVPSDGLKFHSRFVSHLPPSVARIVSETPLTLTLTRTKHILKMK